MLLLRLAVLSSLLTHLSEASPAWLLSDRDIADTVNDPDHNKLGAVASESSICSSIGIDILKAGGNAADTLVATVFCIGVVGMYHRLVPRSHVLNRGTDFGSGIGGGGFMLLRTSEGEFINIDFREMAPAAAFKNMYKNDSVGPQGTCVLAAH